MANNKYITVDQLNNVISKIDKNFSKKKNSLTKVELKELKVADFPNGEITKDGLYLVETYVDHGVLEADGVTTRVHVDYIEVNVELGTSIEDWTSGKDYKVNDLVIVNGTKLYRCKTAPQVDNTVFDKTEWQLVGTSGTIYTKTIDSTSFTLIDGVYEYEFTNPYNNKNIIASLQKEDGTLLLDTLIISDNTIKVKLNVAETVIVNIAGYELNETLIEKDALTDEQKRLLKIVSDYEKEITNLKVVETLDTDGITVLSKELQFNGEKVLTKNDLKIETENLDFSTF